jgi:hypothetical protein
MTRFKLIPVLLVSSLVTATTARGAEEPVSGSRIRVTAPSIAGKRLVGVIVGLDETTLRIEREEGQPPIAVPRASITKIETSRHRSRKGQGAAIGAVFGLAAALVVGATAGSDCSNSDTVSPLRMILCYNRGEVTALAGVLTVPAGMLLGALAFPGEEWEVMGVDRLRLAVTPALGGGVRAAVAIRF